MIDSYSFGSMSVKGKTHSNDLKIIENQIVGNWWRKEGHALYSEDIDDILYSDVETLVVGTGAYGNMRVTAEVKDAVDSRGIEMLSAPTEEAASMFNSLRAQGKKVAGAFHLTC
jgi:hypothetical protein